MFEFDASVVFQPDDSELTYLPEGPSEFSPGVISWVAIQHGGDSQVGSINLLNLSSGENRKHDLPGRPGFAFPTNDPAVFLTGFERQVGFFNIETGEWVGGHGEVRDDGEGTIINDGEPCGDGVLFGTKDPEFKDPKGGLYFWRAGMEAAVHLQDGQTCSNGKVIVERDGQVFVLDIDTPTKKVVEYPLDLANLALGEPRTVIDLAEVGSFPDGMVGTPDGKSVIIAMYNPEDASAGEARQHSLETGKLEGVWKTAQWISCYPPLSS